MRSRLAMPIVMMAALVATALPAAAGTGALAGTVTDDAGSPLASICVAAFPAFESEQFAFATTETDLDGRYRLQGLEDGPHDVRFDDCDPSPRYASAERSVSVSGGATRTLDVSLTEGGFVSGTVRTDAGDPAPGICVVVGDEAGTAAVAEVRTHRDGTYRAGPLAPGLVLVAFIDCRTTPTLVGEFHPGVRDVDAAEHVAVTAGAEVPGVDADLAVGGRVRGTVVDPAGDAHPGACVVAVAADDGDGFGLAVTGPDGGWDLGGLPTGTYQLVGDRCGDGLFSLLGQHGDEAQARTVEVTEGETSTGGTFVVAPAEVARVQGEDRVATALAVAAASPPPSGGVALLARSDDPADALAGASLAAAEDAPLLLTAGDRLDSRVSAALPGLGIVEVVLLGGQAALSPAIEGELTELGVTTRRMAGADRYATAAAIAAGTGATSAWLVRGDTWADALAVAPFAGGQPILLTAPDRLPEATRQAIEGMDGVTIVGGSGAVSHEVADAVAAEVPVVVRIAGADRYATAARLLEVGGAELSDVWVVSGDGWADGLAAGAAAARSEAGAIVPVDGHDLADSAATSTLLRERGHEIVELHVVGGARVISDAVYEELAGLVPATCAASPRC